jgi:hypothetical protein
MKCSYGTSHVVKNSAKAVDCGSEGGLACKCLKSTAAAKINNKSSTNSPQQNARPNSENQNGTHLKHHPLLNKPKYLPENVFLSTFKRYLYRYASSRGTLLGDVVRVSDRVGVAVVCVGAGERVRITSRFGLFHKAQKYYSTRSEDLQRK